MGPAACLFAPPRRLHAATTTSRTLMLDERGQARHKPRWRMPVQYACCAACRVCMHGGLWSMHAPRPEEHACTTACGACMHRGLWSMHAPRPVEHACTAAGGACTHGRLWGMHARLPMEREWRHTSRALIAVRSLHDMSSTSLAGPRIVVLADPCARHGQHVRQREYAGP
eukprot:365831-Chlamydomonas_euryale.AAC.2